MHAFIQDQEGQLELQGRGVIPPFLLEVAMVRDVIKDVREGKARRVVAVARGELVKAWAMQASAMRLKRKCPENEESEEEKASDTEGDGDKAQGKGKGKDEGANVSEGKDKDRDEGKDEKDDDEDDEGKEGSVLVKHRCKVAKVSGPPGTMVWLMRPTGANEG
jgi:hypothetical protein